MADSMIEQNTRVLLPTIEKNARFLLIVEGKDEKNLFEKLIEQMKVENLQVLPIGGKTNLRGNLESLVSLSEFNQIESIGVIRDADEDADGAFQSVADALERYNPPPEKQLVPTGNKPIWRVMILPGNGRKGAMETICIESVKGHPAMGCVEKYLHCCDETEKLLKLQAQIDKAKAYSFIATRKPPEDEIGVGAKQGHWDFDSHAFDGVKEFILAVVGP